MVWIYLIVQAVGLGIIAWCFKVENKDGYATTCSMGGLFSLFLAVVAAPIPVKLLTGLLIMLFRSRISLPFAGEQEAILNSFKASFPALSALGSTGFDLVSRLMPERLNPFPAHSVSHQQQEQETADVNYPNSNINNIIIDIEAVEVTHWF